MRVTFKNPEDYQLIRYPAGEIEVRLTERTLAQLTAEDNAIIVDARCSAGDLDELSFLMQALYYNHPSHAPYVILNIPHLPYARNDRAFVKGGSIGIDFVQRMLRGPAEIRTLDVHNPAELIGPEYHNTVPLGWMRNCLNNFSEQSHGRVPYTVLFPDKGAAARYDGNLGEIHREYATKERDPETGKFLRFTVPSRLALNRQVIIVDDLCDAGGTFVGIASALRDTGYTGRLGLCTTHGIYSKGFDELSRYFGTIYCTDSYPRPGGFPSYVKVTDAINLMENKHVNTVKV